MGGVDGVSRRRLLAGSAGLAAFGAAGTGSPARAAAGSSPAGAAPAATAPTGASGPIGAPVSGGLRREQYRNWSGELTADGVLTCRPRTPQEIVALANWALANGYRLRAKGYAHGWSPLTIAADTAGASNVVLVDTTAHLTGIATDRRVPDTPAVRVQAGAAMNDLLAFCENHGYGLTATPAPGDLSVAGALAIDAHGTAIPAVGEAPVPGDSYGSLCDRVAALTAVVWDGARGRYVLRSYRRTDPECAVLLTHLGRAFVTEVTLRVRADYRLRCLSDVSIPAAELFAEAGDPQARRTFASFVDAAGRVEAIWFPFTAAPWLKVWSISPQQPPTARATTTPYNYPFTDNVPEPVADLAGRLVAGEWWLAPVFGQAQYAAALAGLTTTASSDLWGWSKNLLLYVKPTTLRMHANGYAVAARRADIQSVVSAFVRFFGDRLAAYAGQGRYPVNGPVEIRVSGLDGPGPTGRDAGWGPPPALSAIRARTDHPEWDVVVWLDVLTLPGTPDAADFYRDIERFLFATFAGARPEWSKGWAYTAAGAWTDDEVLTSTIPQRFRAGTDPSWDETLAVLDACDPHRIFSNPFLDRLLPPPTRPAPA